MKPIGIDIPITRGEQGLFKQTFTTFDAIKSNLTNLLLTRSGERPLNPTFGNSLSEKIFESDIELTRESIKDIIRRMVTRYEPSVVINTIEVGDINTQSLNVSVTFSIKSYPSFIDRLNIDLNIR